MPLQTPEEFERSIMKIAELVLAPDSMPGKIMNATPPGDYDESWNPDAERRNFNAAIDTYIGDVEAATQHRSHMPA